jgi:hypothetical protein
MEGIVFVCGLLLGSTVIALRSRSTSAVPGVLFALGLAAGGVWYVFT